MICFGPCPASRTFFAGGQHCFAALRMHPEAAPRVGTGRGATGTRLARGAERRAGGEVQRGPALAPSYGDQLWDCLFDVLKARSDSVTFGGMSSSCRNQELRSNFSMRGGRGGFSDVGSEFCLGISVR